MKSLSIVSLTFIAAAAAASSSPIQHDKMGEIRNLYWQGKKVPAGEWLHPRLNLSWARKRSSATKLAPIDRASLLYWLASVDDKPDPYVRRLVKTALAAGVGMTQETDTL